MNKKIVPIMMAGLITVVSATTALAAEVTFKDVAADFWGKDAVSWAASKGLMGKNADGTYTENFRPNETLTRAELATVLKRYYELTNPTLSSENKPKNIFEVAESNTSFSTFVSLAKAAGLEEMLTSEDDKFTILAPNNAAFDKLGATAVAELFKPENRQKLMSTLSYHIIPSKILSSDLTDGQKVRTLYGREFTVSVKTDESTKKKTIQINGATVLTADVTGENGVIHVVSEVIIPKVVTPAAATTPAPTTGTTTPAATGTTPAATTPATTTPATTTTGGTTTTTSSSSR
jgi:uncharacterized surface protein with fasciclin (FAS1) repeats